jgi:hypothetical protein
LKIFKGKDWIKKKFLFITLLIYIVVDNFEEGKDFAFERTKVLIYCKKKFFFHVWCRKEN